MVKAQGETLVTCKWKAALLMKNMYWQNRIQAIRCFQPRSISLLFIELCVFFYTSGLQGHPKTFSIAFLWSDTILICSSAFALSYNLYGLAVSCGTTSRSVFSYKHFFIIRLWLFFTIQLNLKNNICICVGAPACTFELVSLISNSFLIIWSLH